MPLTTKKTILTLLSTSIAIGLSTAAFAEESLSKHILTPPPSPEPRINGAKVFGVRPGNPFFFKVPATGTGPLNYAAEKLPEGLSIDSKTGVITGKLDLGTVAETAMVTLNVKDLGVLWCAPRRIEITDALEAGENELKIEVVNNWPNRLIGDGKLPAEQRRTRTNIEKYNPLKTDEHSLLPSGLLGPVTISTTE